MLRCVFVGRFDFVFSIICQLFAEIDLQRSENFSRVTNSAELFTFTKVHYLAELQTLLNYLRL